MDIYMVFERGKKCRKSVGKRRGCLETAQKTHLGIFLHLYILLCAMWNDMCYVYMVCAMCMCMVCVCLCIYVCMYAYV